LSTAALRLNHSVAPSNSKGIQKPAQKLAREGFVFLVRDRVRTVFLAATLDFGYIEPAFRCAQPLQDVWPRECGEFPQFGRDAFPMGSMRGTFDTPVPLPEGAVMRGNP
jgi:hypothetical protein